MDLLTTYKHDSELRAITAPPLFSTIHKSPQHPLSFSQPAVPSPAVPWQRLLKVEILQLHALRFCLHSFPCRTHWRPFHTNLLVFSSQVDFQLTTKWVASIVFKISPLHGPHKNSFQQELYCCVRIRCRGNVFSDPLLINGLHNTVVYSPVA
jgi:hypothetical protein